MKARKRPPIEGGLTVKFNKPVADDENLLAISLIQNAYKHPEVIDQKQIIRCSQITFPANIAKKISPNISTTQEIVSIPPKDFVRIVENLMEAQLVLRLTYWNGDVDEFVASYLPVTLIPDNDDPAIIFMHTPQCYFEEQIVNGQTVRQMIPHDEMRQTMIDCARKAGVIK